MNNKYFLLVIILPLFLSGCLKYETQFEGPYSEESIDEPDVIIEHVLVLLAGGDVYLANKFVQDYKLIEDEGVVKFVSINNNHTKVAFKRDNENIQIYDIASSAIVDEVPDSDKANWFDFHANNETIYFYSSWLLRTYGPEVLLNNPTDIMDLSPISGSSVYLTGVAVLANGNIIYAIGTSNGGDRLYLSDGVSNLANSVFIQYRKSLRLNQSEDAVWVTNEYNNKLHIHNTTTMEEEDADSDYYIGAPIELGGGYKVSETSSSRIYFPTAAGIIWRTSPDSKAVTAIDH